MLQAVEAEVTPDGHVTLLEPVRLPETARAVLTILAPLGTGRPVQGSAAELLRVLDSPAFAEVAPGDPSRMEREIAANRDAWGD